MAELRTPLRRGAARRRDHGDTHRSDPEGQPAGGRRAGTPMSIPASSAPRRRGAADCNRCARQGVRRKADRRRAPMCRPAAFSRAGILLAMPPSLRPVLPQRATADAGQTKESVARHRALFANFFRRELSSRYLGSITGLAWAFLHPLALLAVYHFVFTTIFRAGAMRRQELPAVRRGRAVAVARRAGGAAARNGQHRQLRGLIRKVAFPHEIVVYASVAATLALQFAGYLVVLVVLALFGEPVHFEGLLLAMPLWIVLAIAVTGIALALAALQVFVQDVEHVLMPVLMILMYLTPILYPLSLVPEQHAAVGRRQSVRLAGRPPARRAARRPARAALGRRARARRRARAVRRRAAGCSGGCRRISRISCDADAATPDADGRLAPRSPASARTTRRSSRAAAGCGSSSISCAGAARRTCSARSTTSRSTSPPASRWASSARTAPASRRC